MTLCTYSRSEIFAAEILPDCPLKLTHAQHSKCPCRRREFRSRDLRVLTCTFPNSWKGEPIRDPDRLRAALANRTSKAKPAGAKPKQNKEAEKVEVVMTEETTATPMATPAADVKARGKPPLWGGTRIPVLGVTGEKYAGKSLFVSSIDPERTLMIDLEKSTETYSIPYKKRLDLYAELQKRIDADPKRKGSTPTPLDAFIWFKETLEGVKPGEYSVIAVDPISDIEQGLTDWVYENPSTFGRSKAQYDKAGGLLFGDVKAYWKMMLGMLSTRCETFAFTTHMGFVWKGSAPTSERKAKGKETLFELASLYVEVQRKPNEKGEIPAAPVGVVKKSRLAVTQIIDGEVTHTPILPPRLKVCTPKAIREYIAAPPDYSKLKKEEKVETEVMTGDEKLRLEAEIAADKRAAAELEMSRFERMREAAKEQAARMAEQKERAAAAVTTTGTATTATAPTATSSNGNGSHPENPPFDPTSKKNESNTPDVYEIVMAQRKELGLTDAQWAGVLAKRGAKETRDLTLDQAEEIRKNLWQKITARDMEKEGSAAILKNRLAATQQN